MSLRLENLIQPFSAMSHEQKLGLIMKVRANRAVVRPTREKTKEAHVVEKKARKVTATSKSKAKAALAALSPQELQALLTQIEQQEGESGT